MVTDNALLDILRGSPFVHALNSGLSGLMISAFIFCVPYFLNSRYSFIAWIASSPKKVLANSLVF